MSSLFNIKINKATIINQVLLITVDYKLTTYSIIAYN